MVRTTTKALCVSKNKSRVHSLLYDARGHFGTHRKMHFKFDGTSYYMPHGKHAIFRRNVTIFVNLGFFWHFETSYKYKNMDKFTHILENDVRCKYFEAGAHVKNPIKNSYQDG